MTTTSSGCCAETPFRAQQTEQPHGHQSEAGPSTPLSLRPTEPDSVTHPADMPQIKLRSYRTRQWNTKCRHAPDQALFLQNQTVEHQMQTCPRSSSVPIDPDSVTHADMSQLLHVEDSLACGDPPMQNKLPGPQQEPERSACFAKQTWGSDQGRQEEDRDF